MTASTASISNFVSSPPSLKMPPYSHTFENKSSLAANPVAGFGAAVPAPGFTGAALLQPPKSSSALTIGGPLRGVLNPPPPPGTMLWFASEVPEAHPKPFELVCIGSAALATGGLILIGAVSGVLQASFDPHASLLDHPLDAAVEG